ncbi:ATP-dependent helicase HrpA [Arthrobacter sp. PAMC 25486]|uniref:ATP-dependent RNA helicase HrpA n=1 Tax=Arthrobacter sp. PAMC 25486 TaxID=1494608 RepID=UPI000536390A|nr:ATP-dependent RNA helicase HrpA [Arthrobacter sp. PAMC 25486]AIY01094.1 ATP-dependent helicase HrpA [Arthrobacter sp. PAMC 25486]
MTFTISYPAALPVSERREDIMAAIAANQVTIIAGETGSGKTTQIPKMCVELGLAEKGLIGHTQPRRLAARTVAERIASELGVEIGEEVGFQVRFTGHVGPKTKIKLMTDGILLAEIQRDRLLRKYSVIIIDEAHERSLNIDFILGYLRQILPQRPDLKIVITSATIDPERFATHFAASEGPAPIIEVSGRTFPVDIRYRPLSGPANGENSDGMDDDEPGSGADRRGSARDKFVGDREDGGNSEEDRDPLDAVCDAVDELAKEAPGDILIFFSGEREIRDAADALHGRAKTNPRLRDVQILPLFARLSLAEQHAVFTTGSRKRIVLATNVAETSLTVPGIKYVIDTGTARISRYSHRTKVQRLPIERVSQASANQRSGRCGRVSDGICIRLYSEEDYNARSEFTDPEILRTNLAAVILQMTAMGVAKGPKDVEKFPFVQPPDSRAITDGVTLLRELGAVNTQGGITAVGRQLSQLPVDPRLGRMIVEAAKRGVAAEVMVLAAALTIQDPRERPTDKQQLAQEKHKRFVDEHSDFTGFLNLWRYIKEKQNELSSSAFRRLCKAEFINYLRVREWQDLFSQLKAMAKSLDIKVSGNDIDPVGNHDAIHMSLLTGLLSHIGLYDQRKREYAGARGTKFMVFPGSALFKKSPDWVMAAELVETSRLWARVAAKFDPLWAEQVAPDLVKRTYSEPHWSKKMGSVMAHEKVTLYGVPIVPDRRIHYGKIDPELSREMFIRHALVEGDWHTNHKFFHRNQALLAEVEELETRMRRRDLRVDDETLFDFYDERVGGDVVSERHFDKWWKDARHENAALLDFDTQVVMAEEPELDEAAFPKTWVQGEFVLPLSYEFHPTAPGSAPNPSDGVTVQVPLLFLNQLHESQFRWQIPGLRAELVTALIKSLPKAVRKNFIPAPDVGRQAAAALASDFDPATDQLEPSLELALRRLKGHVIPPGSWNRDAIPSHLRMTFSVVDKNGRILEEGQDLSDLQSKLAGATRRAIAESLGATPKTTQAGGAPRAAPATGKNARNGKGGQVPSPSQNSQAGSGSLGAVGPTSTTTGSQKGSDGSGIAERSGITSWDMGTLPREVKRLVAGHTVTGYPALVDEGATAGIRVFQRQDVQESAMRGGVIRLLALRVPSPDRYVLDHLSNTEKLTFSQNPHGSVTELIADCTLATIDKLTPAALPWSEVEFNALYETVRAELIDTVFTVTAVVERVLASNLRIQKALRGTTSLPLISALNDIKQQLELLVYPGFVAKTGFAQLSQLPRYLTAIERRLEKLPSNVNRDGQSMAAVQHLEDEYDDATAALLPGQRSTAGLEHVRWMIEELRVSLFAVELGTAYSVSEKRIRVALAKSLA